MKDESGHFWLASIVIMFVMCVFSAVFSFSRAEAVSGDHGRAVIANNLSDAPSISTRPLLSSDESGLSSEDSKSLINRFEKISSAVRNVENSLQSENSEKRTIAERTLTRSGKNPFAEAKIHYREKTGTPLQIKGKMLQPATDNRTLSRKKQDESTARMFLRAFRGQLKIDDPDGEFIVKSMVTDSIDRRHIRFSQVYKNLPVWPCELIVHLDKAGNVDLMNGAFVATPRKIVTRPVISSDEAVDIAVKHVDCVNDENVKAPELIVHGPGNLPARLGWKVELPCSIQKRWLVVVDAVDGTIRQAFNQVKDFQISGAGRDINGIPRALNIWRENNTFFMVDTSKSMFNASASNPPAQESTFGAITIFDAQNQPETSDVDSIPRVVYVTSNSATSGWLPDAVSAAWNFSQTYDYYMERHGRSSIDGKGGSVYAIVRIGRNWPNAAWVGDLNTMIFGDALPFAGSLDVVAHEMTHGVVSNTANLIYQYQSGALDEGFADIFGEMTEARANYGNPDWLMGTGLSEPIRSLSNPGQYKAGGGRYFPARMSDYINTSSDEGGVHMNSTIFSHAYYLLASGLDGALGIKISEKIFYRALVYNLVASSQFIDARLACISSAEELYGAGSVHAQKTAEAFDTVEIYDSSPTPHPDEVMDTQPVDGPDSALFVYYNANNGGYYLGRRETGDPEGGIQLSDFRVNRSRASVSEDGTLAVFVNENNDMCFKTTNGQSPAECMGWDDVYSVAMSKDASMYGFVFLDETGEPKDSIALFDLAAKNDREQVKIFDLVAPAIDGVSMNNILYAEAMNLTSDNRYIIYDAYNVIQLNDGSKYGAWSIYAIDIELGQTLVLVSPAYGLDIGFPALSQTNDNFITFDAYDTESGESTIYTLNMIKGNMEIIAKVSGNWGTPSYTGDDGAIIYSIPNPSVTTGFSILRQPLEGDRMTSSGDPESYISDGDYGTVYRVAASSGDGNDGDGSDGDGSDGDGNDSGNGNSTDAGIVDDGGGTGCFVSTTGSAGHSAGYLMIAFFCLILLITASIKASRPVLKKVRVKP
ncbi:M4 family metallopeptidase [Desulfobacterales bacterium HSG16]|nr:M4 family metallopeptidase [Desulfobacterales bacterium HSG16]